MSKFSCELMLEYFPSITDFDDFYSTYIANCIFNSFLSYSAIVLNIATIHAILKTSSLSKTLKTLLISLAVSDVGVGFLVQPLYIFLVVKWLQQSDPGCFAYWVFTAIVGFVSSTSFFGVVAISVDRFLAIHFHLRYQELVTHKRVVAVVISVWVLSVLSWLLLIPGIYSAFLSSVGIVCLLLTALIYSRVYVVLRRHQNQIQAVQVNQVAQDGNDMANFASVRKYAVCTFYTYFVFVVCYVPLFSCSIAYKVYGPSIAIKKFLFYSATLVLLNSTLNPIIYCWKMRNIRCTVINILRNMSWHRN